MAVKRIYEMGANGLYICPKWGEKAKFLHYILIKPLNNPGLGAGFMCVTTTMSSDNRYVAETLQDLH
jgi:hypothetical protein